MCVYCFTPMSSTPGESYYPKEQQHERYPAVGEIDALYRGDQYQPKYQDQNQQYAQEPTYKGNGESNGLRWTGTAFWHVCAHARSLWFAFASVLARLTLTLGAESLTQWHAQQATILVCLPVTMTLMHDCSWCVVVCSAC